jgi:hypothetical protein
MRMVPEEEEKGVKKVRIENGWITPRNALIKANLPGQRGDSDLLVENAHPGFTHGAGSIPWT